MEVHKHAFVSKHEYKRNTYAQNDSNTLCLYYEGILDRKTERAFKLVSLYDLAALKLHIVDDISKEPYYATAEVGRGKNKTEAPLTFIIQTGYKVIFFKEDMYELKSIPNEERLKRLFVVYKFNETGTTLIYLQHHLEARPDSEIGKGDTVLDTSKYQPRLTMVASNFKCAIEGKDFDVMYDGEIKWLF